MGQRAIEMLIGRLITDEDFRRAFEKDPKQTLIDLCDLGVELTETEIASLVNTDPALWERAAGSVDPRLQKVSLKSTPRIS